MSRTYRSIPPKHEYLRDVWYKYQEEKRFGRGKGVWMRSKIKTQHSSNRSKVRVAAKKGESLIQKHHKENC